MPLAALQHFAFCPRQCALIHNEQVWNDNYLTAQGQVLHQKVDSGQPETRKGIRFERTVQVSAPSLGITGKLDLVERNLTTGELTPVEYKRGKPKQDDWDEIQLCAQALCLEEMTEQVVAMGALWYWQTRHRQNIAIDEALRQRTFDVINEVKTLFETKITPKAQYAKRCEACSLIDLCNPKLIDDSRNYAANLYITDNEKTTK